MAGGRVAAIVLILQAWGLSAEAGGGEWETCRWEELTTSGEQPAARFDYQMAADEQSGRLFIFGGITEQGRGDDLWMFDPVISRFVPLEPAAGSPRPGPRSGGKMVWAAARRALVLVGGETGQGRGGHAWMFDFPTRWWHRLEAPPGRSPTPNPNSIVAYDPQSGRLVFAGAAMGHGQVPGGDEETWMLDLDEERWQRLASAPGIRPGSVLVTAPRGQRALLVGPRSDDRSASTGTLWWFDFAARTWEAARVRSPLTAADHALGGAFADDGHVLVVACMHAADRPARIEVIRMDVTRDCWSIIGSLERSGRDGRPTARVSAGAAAMGMASARNGVGGITGFLLFGGRPELPEGRGISPLEDLWLLRPR